MELALVAAQATGSGGTASRNSRTRGVAVHVVPVGAPWREPCRRLAASCTLSVSAEADRKLSVVRYPRYWGAGRPLLFTVRR